jgi:hypothetical protein
MTARPEDRAKRSPLGWTELLEFRPWMLALAVFLACAIGITIMEQVRDARDMWAQFTAADAATSDHP